MNGRTKQTMLSLIIGMMTILVCACAIENPLEKTSAPASMQLHGVEPAIGMGKFNLTSASNINRNAKQTWNSHQPLESVESGSFKTWQWTIYAVPSVTHLVQVFGNKRVAIIGSGVSAHTVDIPSLNSAMRELYQFYHTIIGTDMLPLNLQLALYPEDVHVSLEKTLHSNAAIPMYFAFSIPEKVGTDGGAAYSWLIDTLGLVGHEYWHAYNRENKNARFINKMTEEITAYTLERCLRTALSNGQGTFHLVDIGGSPIDIKNLVSLDKERQKLVASPGAVELSFKAKTLSLYNMAWVLKTNIIKKHDLAVQEKLYGLCYAMVHDPVDMTKGFYPADKVSPLPFSG